MATEERQELRLNEVEIKIMERYSKIGYIWSLLAIGCFIVQFDIIIKNFLLDFFAK